MRTHKKTITITVIAIIILCLLGIVLYIFFIQNNKKTTVNPNSLPKELMQGSFIYDTNDIQESVGIRDYVFVATVLHNDGTHYEDKVTIEDENGNPIKVGTPYTDFTVQIISNIKGELKKDTPIKITKHGGVEENQKAVCVFENDAIPEENKTYIFLAYKQEDGSLLISGPNSNILIDADKDLDEQTIKETPEFKTYQEALK